MSRISAWFSGELAKLKGMSLRAKVSYIFAYYWVQLGLIAFVLCFSVYLGSVMRVQTSENHFAACFGNTMADLDAETTFGRDFARYAGYDLSEKGLLLLDEVYCKPGDRSAFNNTYYNLLITYLDSGTLDVLVMPGEDLAAIGASGRLMDLRDERTAALCEQYADRIIYVVPNATSDTADEPVPVGIDLRGTALVGEGAPYSEAVLGVSALAPHPDQVGVFLSYLFGEGGV